MISVKIRCTSNQSSAFEYRYTECQGSGGGQMGLGRTASAVLVLVTGVNFIIVTLIIHRFSASPIPPTAEPQGFVEHHKNHQSRNARAVFKSQVGHFLALQETLRERLTFLRFRQPAVRHTQRWDRHYKLKANVMDDDGGGDKIIRAVKKCVRVFPIFYQHWYPPTPPTFVAPLPYQCPASLMSPLIPSALLRPLLNSLPHLYLLYSHPKLMPRDSHCMAKY